MDKTNKQLLIPIEDYERELQEAGDKGYNNALTIIRHVLNGKIVKQGLGTPAEEWALWEELMTRLKKVEKSDA